jgi:hypothetical protein
MRVLPYVVLFSVVVTTLATLAPARALANPAPDADKEKVKLARQYVDAGLAAQDSGDYDTAITLYSKAYQLVQHPVLIFDLAQAHRLSGHLEQALKLYAKYLVEDPHGTKAEAARALVAELEARRAAARTAYVRPVAPDDAVDPTDGDEKAATDSSDSSADISDDRAAGGKAPTFLLAVSGGTGLGYVNGKTETGNKVLTCCIGSSLVVLTVEFGYYVNPTLSIGAAVRLGIPVGANIDGHSTSALATLVRVHYALSKSGDGLRVMSELGVGLLRNTVTINTVGPPGMDVDVVAQGPLLIGAGIGYTKHLGNSVAFVAELDAIAAIAVVDTLGSAVNLNTGVSTDMNVGLQIGF